MAKKKISSYIIELQGCIEALDSNNLDLNEAADLYAKALKVSKKTLTALEKTNDRITILEAEKSKITLPLNKNI